MQGLPEQGPVSQLEQVAELPDQGKGFAYASTVIDPTLRLTFMSGISDSRYQIPNNSGQTPNFTAFDVSNFDSSQLRQTQTEYNH